MTPFDDVEAWMSSLPRQVQVAEASRLAANFKAITGNPIMVVPIQMKFFRDAGVDCSNLMLYGEIPTE